MTLQVIPSNQLDREAYDKCLANHGATVFVYSWYMDITAGKWLVITDNYKTVLPIAVGRKFGIDYIYQPFFNRHTGIYGVENISFTEAARDYIIKNYSFCDFCIESNDTISKAFKSDQRIYQELTLNDYPSLYEQYSTKLKRSLRLAEKDHVDVRSTDDVASFVSGFKKHTGNKISAFGDNEYSTLDKLLQVCLTNCECRFLSAYHQEQEVASGLFAKKGDQIIYIEGFSNEKGRTLRAMHVIFDHIIQEFAGSGLILDFGGSNIDSIARFFHSFGANDSIYVHLFRNNLPLMLRWAKRSK